MYLPNVFGINEKDKVVFEKVIEHFLQNKTEKRTKKIKRLLINAIIDTEDSNSSTKQLALYLIRKIVSEQWLSYFYSIEKQEYFFGYFAEILAKEGDIEGAKYFVDMLSDDDFEMFDSSMSKTLSFIEEGIPISVNSKRYARIRKNKNDGMNDGYLLIKIFFNDYDSLSHIKLSKKSKGNTLRETYIYQFDTGDIELKSNDMLTSTKILKKTGLRLKTKPVVKGDK